MNLQEVLSLRSGDRVVLRTTGHNPGFDMPPPVYTVEEVAGTVRDPVVYVWEGRCFRAWEVERHEPPIAH